MSDLLARTGLRGAGDGIPASNPDAALLADLATLVDLKGDRDAAYKNWNAPPAKRSGTRPDAKAAYMRAAGAHETLEQRVIDTPAQTEAGAVAKLRFALKEFGPPRPGTMPAFPISAMLDALVVVLGCSNDEAAGLTKRHRAPHQRKRGAQ